MSSVDVGKDAKHMGRTRPSVARKADPVPPKATPKMVRKPKGLKCFGFETRMRFRHWQTNEWNEWGKWALPQWYPTAKRRDQAMFNYHGYWTNPGKYEVQTRPVERV